MRKYKNLILIPVFVIIVCLYLIGLNIIKRQDNFEQPAKIESVAVSGEKEEADERIDLNTATKEELMTLEGIGEKRAEMIIEKRTELGGFKYAEQIVEVKDIGAGIYEKIKDKIYVQGE